MIPREKTSVRRSTGRPETCSGDMYGAVPMMTPSRVWRSVSISESKGPSAWGTATLASPKSSTLTRPSPATMTFAGLRSRWTMPRSWAAASASATAEPISRTCSIGIPSSGINRSSESPSTSCMVRKCRPSLSSTEYTPTTPGWSSEASIIASRRNRSSRSGFVAISSGSTLRATSRPSLVSVARYTAPIPPVPSSPVMR